MKICHVCGFSCEDKDELCPICGAELLVNEETEQDAVSEEEVNITIEKPCLAASVSDPVIAEIFCDKLKDNGILFTYDEPDLSASMHMGFGGFYAEINVYVSEDDLDKAKEIFEELENEEPAFEDDFEEEI